MGDSPQGDVEGLGHAHLEAVKAHLELGRDRVSCGPGCRPPPPRPGQLHLAQLEPRVWGRGGGAPRPWARMGCGAGRAARTGQGTAVLPGTGLGLDRRVQVRHWPHLLPCLPAGGPGDLHSLALRLLGVQARGADLQALQALCGERAHGLSDHAVPCEGSEQGLSAPPQSAVRLSWGEREVLGPAGPLRVWFPEP